MSTELEHCTKPTVMNDITSDNNGNEAAIKNGSIRVAPNKGKRTRVYPLKNLSDIQAIQRYFLDQVKNAKTDSKRLLAFRNWLFFALGINMARRGGDLSELVWGQIVRYNPESRTYTVREDEYNRINEEKTSKDALLVYNAEARRCINFYLKETGIEPFAELPVFPSSRAIRRYGNCYGGN